MSAISETWANFLIFGTLQRALEALGNQKADPVPVVINPDELANLDRSQFGEIVEVLQLLNGKRVGNLAEFVDTLEKVRLPAERTGLFYRGSVRAMLHRCEELVFDEILNEARKARAQLYAEFATVPSGIDRFQLVLNIKNVGRRTARKIHIHPSEPAPAVSGHFIDPATNDFDLEPYSRQRLLLEIQSSYSPQFLPLKFPFVFEDDYGFQQKGVFVAEIRVPDGKIRDFEPIAINP
jgi:hypothetical protein